MQIDRSIYNLLLKMMTVRDDRSFKINEEKNCEIELRGKNVPQFLNILIR